MDLIQTLNFTADVFLITHIKKDMISYTIGWGTMVTSKFTVF